MEKSAKTANSRPPNCPSAPPLHCCSAVLLPIEMTFYFLITVAINQITTTTEMEINFITTTTTTTATLTKTGILMTGTTWTADHKFLGWSSAANGSLSGLGEILEVKIMMKIKNWFIKKIFFRSKLTAKFSSPATGPFQHAPPLYHIHLLHFKLQLDGHLRGQLRTD